VMPVLTDDAELPAAAELPEDLAELARCQLRRLRRRDAGADVARLVADLAEVDASLQAALGHGPYGPVVCPYPGMVAFGPQDAPFFRGRDSLIESVLSRLAVQVRRGGAVGGVRPRGGGEGPRAAAGPPPRLCARGPP